MTILLQSRPSRLSDVLTSKDVDEIADTPAGSVQSALKMADTREGGQGATSSPIQDKMIEAPTRLRVASIGQDDKVVFKNTDDFQSFSK